MKSYLKLTTLSLGVLLIFSSCASIFSKSSYPITIKSTPSEAKISIKDKRGIEIFTGETPASLNLKASSGFFEKARYQVTFSKNGYDKKTVPVEFKIDGWYFGNLLVGGLLGMLIVDPATGAMYKLETEYINANLRQSTAHLTKEKLNIYSIDDIPAEWRNHLVEITAK